MWGGGDVVSEGKGEVGGEVKGHGFCVGGKDRKGRRGGGEVGWDS